jgi:hypothetical protein
VHLSRPWEAIVTFQNKRKKGERRGGEHSGSNVKCPHSRSLTHVKRAPFVSSTKRLRREGGGRRGGGLWDTTHLEYTHKKEDYSYRSKDSSAKGINDKKKRVKEREEGAVS